MVRSSCWCVSLDDWLLIAAKFAVNNSTQCKSICNLDLLKICHSRPKIGGASSPASQSSPAIPVTPMPYFDFRESSEPVIKIPSVSGCLVAGPPPVARAFADSQAVYDRIAFLTFLCRNRRAFSSRSSLIYSNTKG